MMRQVLYSGGRVCRRSMSTVTTSPASTSVKKMEADKRYQASQSVPETLLKNANSVVSFGHSIRGEARAGRPAYMDFQATTPMDPRVLDAMLPYMAGRYGNPHSKTHSFGWETEEAIEVAREHVAKLLGASAKEVVFTSGATESNNLSLKGVAHFYQEKKKHVITCQTEHKCVLDSCRVLEQEGFKVTYLPVDSNGRIVLDDLRSAISKDTSIVSIMGVNNEIGVVQPLHEIGEICRQHKAFFHSDLAQMAGKMPISVDDFKVDLASVSSHKVGTVP